MCGITGLLSITGNDCELESNLRRMAYSIKHRGPDNTGFWSDSDVLFKVAHQRLSIIDLSNSGNQPMLSNSGRYVIALNGEIYNHDKLRNELENSNHNLSWRGHSDTEVLLSLIEEYGIKQASIT